REPELYFETEAGAEKARMVLEAQGIETSTVETIEPQDWDAQWKASFTGADIAPYWRIRPYWEVAQESQTQAAESPGTTIRINPGAGFGTGTHETTQLCLQVLGQLGESR